MQPSVPLREGDRSFPERPAAAGVSLSLGHGPAARQPAAVTTASDASSAHSASQCD